MIKNDLVSFKNEFGIFQIGRFHKIVDENHYQIGVYTPLGWLFCKIKRTDCFKIKENDKTKHTYSDN